MSKRRVLIVGAANPSWCVPGLFLAFAVLSIFASHWKDDTNQAAQIMATGIAPQNDFESAIVTTLPPCAYTAVVAGNNGGTGVAVAEVYHLP